MKFKKKNYFFILLLILFLSIGFAVLSSNLNLSALFSFKKNTYDVHFENVVVTPDAIETTDPVIDNNSSITFGGKFNVPGDFYEFSVDVVNSGTLDAMVSEFIKTGINDTNKDYFTYSVKYYNGNEININDLLKHGAKTRIIVRIEYNYDIDNFVNLSEQNFAISLKFIQATSDAVEVDNLYESENSNLLILNNAQKNSLTNLKIYGNSEQTKFSQMLQKEGLSTPKDDSEFWDFIDGNATPLEDGWIKLSARNLSTENFLYINFRIAKAAINLEPSTEYTIYAEFRNYSGSGIVCFGDPWTTIENDPIVTASSKCLYQEDLGVVNGTKKIKVTTKSNLDSTIGLRSFARLSPQDNMTVELRITIVNGDQRKDNLTYDKYDGEISNPSPKHQRKITNVEKNNQLIVHNKNILDIDAFKTKSISGVTVNVGDNQTITVNGKTNHGQRIELATVPLFFEKGKKYIQKIKILSGSFTPYIPSTDWAISSYALPDFEHIINNNEIIKTYTPTNDTYHTPYLWFGYDDTVGEGDAVFDNFTFQIQVEVGDKSTDYVPGESRIYPINLNNLELSGIGDYKDYIYNNNGKWYIHREIMKQRLSDAQRYSTSVDGKYRWRFSVPGGEVCDLQANSALSTIAPLIGKGQTSSANFGFTIADDENMYFYYGDWSTKSESEVNEWLDNNPSYVYYPLKKPIQEEITDSNLVTQLNAILQNNLFEGQNYIYVVNDNLVSKIDFDYQKNS